MADEYIKREAFLDHMREQYCKDCARRKGMRNGKYKTLYEIGEAPCRACETDNVLNDVDDFPAADVVEVVRCKDCKHYQHDALFDQDWCDGRCVTPDYFCADGERRSMDGGADDA